jgi:hypothetical protein
MKIEMKVTKLNILLTAVSIGLIASIAFILIQPFFGMVTLTSRHASAYLNNGAYSETSALIVSWMVHVGVSIFYALLSTIIFNINHSILVSFGQVIVLGWLTTLAATPANEFVVKFITTEQFPALSSLSALNTEVGPKLWLHILFFAFVLAGVWLTRIKAFSKR